MPRRQPSPHHPDLRLVVDNSSSGSSTPRSLQTLKRRKWMRSGKALARFQLLTAGELTPNSWAVAFVPPSSSMMRDTSMPQEYSQCVNIVKWGEREPTSTAREDTIRRMKLLQQKRPRSVEAIAERLELTRKALGMNQRQFALTADLTPPAYSNWIKRPSRPDLDSAFKLCDAHDLTIEWIYEGDAARLPARIVEAIRKQIAAEGGKAAA